MDPTITVIIPTFNRLKFLGEALDSIGRQTRAPDEVIVVDDGSTDGTAGALAERPTIRYVTQKNAGPSAARNLGMRHASSEWIAFLDSDDLWLPDKLERQVGFLRANPQVDFVFGTQVNLREGIQELAPEILDRAAYRRLQQGSPEIRDLFHLLLRVNPIPTSSVIFRKSILSDVGYFDERLWRCEDLDLWLRFAVRSKVAFIDRPLVAKRAQEDNLINDYIKLWGAHLEVLRGLPARHPEMKLAHDRQWKAAVAGTAYRLASYDLSYGRTDAARRWFSELDTRDLPLLSRDRFLARLKKIMLVLHLGPLARTAKLTGAMPPRSKATT